MPARALYDSLCDSISRRAVALLKYKIIFTSPPLPRVSPPLDRYLAHPLMTVVEVALGVVLLTSYASVAMVVLVLSLAASVFVGTAFWARRLKRNFPRSVWAYLILMAVVFTFVPALAFFGSYEFYAFVIMTAILSLSGFIVSLYLAFQKAGTSAILSSVLMPTLGVQMADVTAIAMGAALWLFAEWLFSKRPKSMRGLLAGVS
jgi:hypothetical protein